MGLEKAGRIGRVEIDPRNPDVVLGVRSGPCLWTAAGPRRIPNH